MKGNNENSYLKVCGIVVVVCLFLHNLFFFSAATNLKKVSLELGGKSPLIIFNDCDLDRAVKMVMDFEIKYTQSLGDTTSEYINTIIFFFCQKLQQGTRA